MKISIVTPSFNQVEFIERTIQSVLKQDCSDIEYIVMDGGSTDGTVEILKKYTDKIIWKSEKDSGQSDAINKGLKMATGDVIAYLNSDDTYEPNTLRKVADYFQNNPSKKWVLGKCRIINEKDQEIRKPITFYKNLFLKRYNYGKLLAENFICQPAVFWRREILDEIGFFNESESFCMDYEYWLRIGKKYKPGFIDAYLANFRYYPGSKSGSVNKKQFQDELRIAKKYGNGHIPSILLHKFNYHKITGAYKLIVCINKINHEMIGKYIFSTIRRVRFFLKVAIGKEIFYRIQKKTETMFLGSEYGGWDINPKNISHQSIIYSFGIGEDISFDLDLIKKFGCKVFAFDPTPKSRDWLKRQNLPDGFIYNEFGIANFDGKQYFYPPVNSKHVSYSVVPKNTEPLEVEVSRLETITTKLNHAKIDILKMDIEGSEYEVLEDIMNCKIEINQILVEFHHRFPQVGIKKTKNAIQSLNEKGYQIFSISSKKEEYSFIKID